MASFFVAPYIPLLFTPIPFSATLEIMSIFLLGLVVIIPTVNGGWNAFSDTRILEAFGGSEYCTEHKDICIPFDRKFITLFAFFYPSLNIFFGFKVSWLWHQCCLCALSV